MTQYVWYCNCKNEPFGSGFQFPNPSCFCRPLRDAMNGHKVIIDGKYVAVEFEKVVEGDIDGKDQ